ncbi:hypothetical protein [Cognatilysobacter segetis]|uniref:hypothetical protein n=1 Tax=Cognatilysobacter segetis TaxID=2492394 RepID=UPI00105F0D02|nr:hypothetical protein [Lysobacter segetis]
MTTWPGWSDENTLVLPLGDAPPDGALTLDGRAFAPKDELHVTLVGRELGAELRAVLGDRLDAATRPAFEALDWSLARSGRRVLIEKPGRTDDGERAKVASVIELVELPALDFFYRWLGELLGRELAVPPAHVTLYTHRKAQGIGIPSLRSLRAWSQGEVAAA